LIQAVKKGEGMILNAEDCRKNAETFALARFKQKFQDHVYRLFATRVAIKY
jgi:hypothetical protein